MPRLAHELLPPTEPSSPWDSSTRRNSLSFSRRGSLLSVSLFDLPCFDYDSAGSLGNIDPFAPISIHEGFPMNKQQSFQQQQQPSYGSHLINDLPHRPPDHILSDRSESSGSSAPSLSASSYSSGGSHCSILQSLQYGIQHHHMNNNNNNNNGDNNNNNNAAVMDACNQGLNHQMIYDHSNYSSPMAAQRQLHLQVAPSSFQPMTMPSSDISHFSPTQCMPSPQQQQQQQQQMYRNSSPVTPSSSSDSLPPPPLLFNASPPCVPTPITSYHNEISQMVSPPNVLLSNTHTNYGNLRQSSVTLNVNCNNVMPFDDDEEDDDELNQQRFKPFHEEKWSVRYKELLEFHKENGHSAVPHTYPKNPQLARWVKRQRRQYKLRRDGRASTMTSERLELLNDVGFIWDSHDVNWREKLDSLQGFKKDHGHCNVPSNYSDKKLATWVKCQRRQYKLYWDGKPSAMSPERILELEKVGFEWEIRAAAPRGSTTGTNSMAAASASVAKQGQQPQMQLQLQLEEQSSGLTPGGEDYNFLYQTISDL